MVEILRKPWKAHQHTSLGHNFWSNCWNFKFFSFMKTIHPELTRDTKIASIQVPEDLQMHIRSQNWKSTWGWNCWHQPGPTWHTKKGLGVPGPEKCARAYKRLLAAQIEGETFWVLFGHLFGFFSSLFSLYFSPKKHKNTSKLLDSSLFSKNTR